MNTKKQVEGRHLFQPGHKLAKGRPKGCQNELTKRHLEMKALAANDYKKAYSILFANVEAGEAWAHQLYFKELAPKRYKEDTIRVILPETIAEKGVTEYLKSFVEGLSKFEDHTKDEVLTTIKALSNVKIAESITENAPIVRPSTEEIRERLALMKETLALTEKHDGQ